MLEWVERIPAHRRLLEIGCGLGRTAVHFAKAFDEVDAVDIAPTMVEKARSLDPPANVHFHVGSGSGLSEFADRSYDVVFSALVFQHIPEGHVIQEYLRDIHRVLTTGGRAVLQFDTRPESWMNRIYKALPDPLLAREHRRFIRRYRRPARDVRAMFERAGLSVVGEHGADGPEHFFVAKPADPRGTSP